MRHVEKRSIEAGRVTLVIPAAYRKTASLLDQEARRHGKTFSTLLWELVDEHFRCQDDLPLPSIRAQGLPFNREDLYEDRLNGI